MRKKIISWNKNFVFRKAEMDAAPRLWPSQLLASGCLLQLQLCVFERGGAANTSMLTFPAKRKTCNKHAVSKWDVKCWTARLWLFLSFVQIGLCCICEKSFEFANAKCEGMKWLYFLYSEKEFKKKIKLMLALERRNSFALCYWGHCQHCLSLEKVLCNLTLC